MIFSRRRHGAKHARADDQRRTGPRHAAGRRASATAPTSGTPEDEDDLLTPPSSGPYDSTEAPAGVARLDLGSLQIPAVDGVEVRVQASPEGVIQQVVLVHGDSVLQLGAFAAPRTEGIWEELRADFRRSLFADGVAVEEIVGEYGVELRARARTPDGLTDLRFLGIDGPRWMVRAIYQGPAARDPSLAGPLAVCLAGLVVDRGQEAMPVREGLPLRLPRELTEAPDHTAAAPPGPVPGRLSFDAGTPTRADPGPTPTGMDHGNGYAPELVAERRKPSPRPRPRV